MADPDLEIRGGGGEGGGHPDPEIRGDGLPKNFFGPSGLILVFEDRGSPEYPGENLSEQRREPTTN